MSNRQACILLLAAGITALLAVAVLAITRLDCSCDAPTHNAHGGYTEACGDQPPMLDDDC